MDLDEIKVEVRDRNLRRVGLVPTGDIITLNATPLHNKVGSWDITLPADHPLAGALRTPGAGLVVTGPDDVIISGPVTSPSKSVTSADPTGPITFSGPCDNVWIADRLAWPDPAWDGTAGHPPAEDYDLRTGSPESVIHEFVKFNAGPGALAERQVPGLNIGPDYGRGAVNVTKSARFDALDELISGIANAANLGWRVVQRGDELSFETTELTNRSRTIRLDTRNGTLSGYKLAVTAPTTTHAIVGALDVDDDRIFATVTTTESESASAAWGRRIEKFVNQSYVDDADEWTASARELLYDEGGTLTSASAIPGEDDELRFGRDYFLGDSLGLVADDQEYPTVVTGAVLKISADNGVLFGLALGDVTVFNQSAALKNQLGSALSRLSAVERNLRASA